MRARQIASRQPLWFSNAHSAQYQLQSIIGAVALIALSATWLFGTPAAALFIITALALVAANPAQTAGVLLKYSPLLFIPILGMISTIWSDAPERTLRAAIQLLLTMIAAILVAKKLPSRTILIVSFLSLLCVVFTVIPYVPRAFATGMPLQGLFSSKNQVGACIHLVVALALALIFERRQRPLMRIGAAVAALVCVLILPLAQSGTGLTSVAVTVLIFPVLLLAGRLPVKLRIILAILCILLLCAAAFLQPQIADAISDFRQNVLKKDATLTGRTYLWDYAERLSAARPLLGYGYYAFWRPGNLDAESLWRWGGIAQKTGFNFHNAFVEIKVDLGLVGQATLIATCSTFLLAAFYRHIKRPSVTMAFFISLQVVLYLRSLSETGLIAPFNIMTVLWVVAGTIAFSDELKGNHVNKAPPQSRRKGTVFGPLARSTAKTSKVRPRGFAARD